MFTVVSIIFRKFVLPSVWPRLPGSLFVNLFLKLYLDQVAHIQIIWPPSWMPQHIGVLHRPASVQFSPSSLHAKSQQAVSVNTDLLANNAILAIFSIAFINPRCISF